MVIFKQYSHIDRVDFSNDSASPVYKRSITVQPRDTVDLHAGTGTQSYGYWIAGGGTQWSPLGSYAVFQLLTVLIIASDTGTNASAKGNLVNF